MSSILKALKKLEGASPTSPGGAPLHRWSSVIPGQAAPRRPRPRWWIGLGLMGLAALLGAALAGGWLWRPTASSAPGRRAALPDAETRPAKTGSPGDTAVLPPKGITPAAPLPPLRAETFPRDAGLADAAAGRSPRGAPAGPAGGNPGEVLPAVRPPPPVTAVPSAGVAMALPGNATDLTPPAQRLPLIDDPGLKLQAIAWSANPAERIAVVNSSILREGDAVEGYRVVRINRDDVMLRGGGGEGRLLFGAK